MDMRTEPGRGGIAHPVPDTPVDHFFKLMFSHESTGDPPRGAPMGFPPTHRYRALVQRPLAEADVCTLPDPRLQPRIGADAPATSVMTALGAVTPVRIEPLATVEEANRTMVAHGVRALFVVDDRMRIAGFVTSLDVLGERPMQAIQQRGIRHDEVAVADIMTPVSRLEFLSMRDVRHATVGDIVVTLVRAGRQHALVLGDEVSAEGTTTVVGMFSLTQVARQMGVRLDPTEMRRMFMEGEADVR